MAKITHSDLAPSEVVHYDLAGVEFELGGSGKSSYETDDRRVLGNAQIHPWLVVEYDKVELIAGKVRNSLADRPDLDGLSDQSAEAKSAFDPDAIKAIEESKEEVDKSHLAVDANLDQGEAISVGSEETVEVAVTLAADEHHEAAKSGKSFDQTDEQANAAATGEGMPEPTRKTTSKKGDD